MDGAMCSTRECAWQGMGLRIAFVPDCAAKAAGAFCAGRQCVCSACASACAQPVCVLSQCECVCSACACAQPVRVLSQCECQC